jgi:hypothetical protein
MDKRPPEFESSDADDRAAEAEAIAELDAGLFISHEDMRAWLEIWGQEPGAWSLDEPSSPKPYP